MFVSRRVSQKFPSARKFLSTDLGSKSNNKDAAADICAAGTLRLVSKGDSRVALIHRLMRQQQQRRADADPAPASEDVNEDEDEFIPTRFRRNSWSFTGYLSTMLRAEAHRNRTPRSPVP